jgi:AAA domain
MSDDLFVPARRAVLKLAQDVRRERLRYLEPGRIPLGLVTVIGGYGGLGKSQYSLLVAAKLTRGEYCEPAAVVIATAEDSPSTTVVPRLEALQADLGFVGFVSIQCDDRIEDGITIPDDLDTLYTAMEQVGAKLLIVDPLVAHLPGQIDSHKDQSVRRALAPLYRLAQELDCAVLALIHFNKAHGLQPLQRLSGSGAFGNAARSVLLLDRDPDDPDGEQGRRRVLAHVKSNDGPEMPSLLYEIAPILLPATGVDPEVETSRLELIGESPHDGRALLASASTSDEERTALDNAVEFLLGELGNDGQRYLVEDLFKAARRNGISDRTLQRARKAIGAQTEKAGFGRGWEWWLPEGAKQTAETAWLREGAVHAVTAPSGVVAPSNGHVDENFDPLEAARLFDAEFPPKGAS